MERKAVRFLLIAILFFPFSVFAQETKQFIGKGLLSAQGAFCSGIMLNSQDDYNMYLDGDLEYYVDNRISIRSETYYLLDAAGRNDDQIFSAYISNFAGAMYHFKSNSGFDPYIGLQPGIAYTRLTNEYVTREAPNLSSNKGTINPVFAVSTGFNFYAEKWFHLFARASYTTGKHQGDLAAVPLDEVKVLFGLGFNIWVIKKDK